MKLKRFIFENSEHFDEETILFSVRETLEKTFNEDSSLSSIVEYRPGDIDDFGGGQLNDVFVLRSTEEKINLHCEAYRSDLEGYVLNTEINGRKYDDLVKREDFNIKIEKLISSIVKDLKTKALAELLFKEGMTIKVAEVVRDKIRQYRSFPEISLKKSRFYGARHGNVLKNDHVSLLVRNVFVVSFRTVMYGYDIKLEVEISRITEDGDSSIDNFFDVEPINVDKISDYVFNVLEDHTKQYARK